VFVRPRSGHVVELTRVVENRVPLRRAKSRFRSLERLERKFTETGVRRVSSVRAWSTNVLHIARDAWDLPN
jgi:hypothetical protein